MTAAAESIPDAQRLQVTGLGVTQGATETRVTMVLVGGLVLGVVLVLGCAGILIGSALRPRWRAAEHEQFEGERRLPPVQEPVCFARRPIKRSLCRTASNLWLRRTDLTHLRLSDRGSSVASSESSSPTAYRPRDPDMQPVGEPGDSEHRDMRRTGAASKLSRVSRFVR